MCGGPVKSTCIEVQLVVMACVLGTCHLTNEEGWWLYCPFGFHCRTGSRGVGWVEGCGDCYVLTMRA